MTRKNFCHQDINRGLLE